MQIVSTIAKLKVATSHYKSIGFVPTMGALHAGHIALVQQSVANNSCTVCSIFVNPTQFNNKQDFEKYPSTIDADIALLQGADCTILYLPTVHEIYPNGITNLKQYELGYLNTILDGPMRVGHFNGVCNVVQRLFEIVQPQQAYFGLKDYQQCMVITQLVTQMNWQHKVKLHLCPTVRMPNGLAMSSRNMRLTHVQQQQAAVIFQALSYVKQHITVGNASQIHLRSETKIAEAGLIPEYLEIRHAINLHPVINWNGSDKLVCLAAAHLGTIRLIDNMLLN